MEQLQAYVKKIHFRQPGFAVGTIRIVDNGKPSKEVKAVGVLPDTGPEELIDLAGDWVDDPKYGLQFRVAASASPLPTTLGGVKRYLANEVKGCGPMRAEKIVNHFGPRVISILEKDPHRLAEVEGIGHQIAIRIGQSWHRDRAERRLGIFLAGFDINPAWATRIYEQLGVEAAMVLQQNPYRLTQVDGIGFKIADRMARKMEWPDDCPERVQAVFSHVLKESQNDGDSCLPRDVLMTRASELVRNVSSEALKEALDTVLHEGTLIAEDIKSKSGLVSVVYLPYLYQAEVGLAERVLEIGSQKFDTSKEHFDKCLAEAELVLGVPLASKQREAVERGIFSSISILTGAPGTGKTTTTRALVETAERMGMIVALAAPTGRAAKRLSEVSSRPAKTIHRLCEFQPSAFTFQRNRSRPLECNLLLIDESSMMDIVLAWHLFEAIPKGCSVVIIGDHNQLPSVGPGTVLKDLIACGKVPVSRLDTIFRQAEGSVIVRNAHRIVRGEQPSFPPAGSQEYSDSYLMEVPGKSESPDWVVDTVVKLCQTYIPKRLGVDPVRDVQVIAPMKKRRAGVEELNEALQKALNPTGKEIQAGPAKFRVGDRIMQSRNNYTLEVFNGDVGFIQGCIPEDQVLVVDFYGRQVLYPYEDAGALIPAYAQTIHRTQGGEFPVVVIVLLKQHYVMLNRNLLYTASTRAKKLAIFVGSRTAIEMAVRNNQTASRNSLLVWRLMRG